MKSKYKTELNNVRFKYNKAIDKRDIKLNSSSCY